jgi:hypothetical protein
MIASAWMGVRHGQRQARWAPILAPRAWVLPFPVVAEMRFGAEVTGWGARRRGVLALSRVLPRPHRLPRTAPWRPHRGQGRTLPGPYEAKCLAIDIVATR